MQSRNLDLLRSCAVLLVAFSHFCTSWGIPARYGVLVHNFGVAGVVIFFVHTSLVLFLSMERMNPKGLVKNFYIRRFFRIYPLCWVSIAFILATGLTDCPPAQFAAMGAKGIFINLMLLQNIFKVGDIEGPLWSLPWEVQMYVVLPFFFLLVSRKNKLIVPVAIWLAATTLALIGTLPQLPRLLHGMTFVPLFIGGMVAFQLRNAKPRFHWLLWPVFIVVVVVCRALLLRGDVLESAWNAMVNALTCLVLGFGIPMFKAITSRSLSYAARKIADYSYGIYLFHLPLLILCFDHFEGVPKLARAALWLILTGLVSILLHHAMEQPFIRFGKVLANLPRATDPVAVSSTE